MTGQPQQRQQANPNPAPSTQGCIISRVCNAVFLTVPCVREKGKNYHSRGWASLKNCEKRTFLYKRIAKSIFSKLFWSFDSISSWAFHFLSCAVLGPLKGLLRNMTVSKHDAYTVICCCHINDIMMNLNHCCHNALLLHDGGGASSFKFIIGDMNKKWWDMSWIWSRTKKTHMQMPSYI